MAEARIDGVAAAAAADGGSTITRDANNNDVTPYFHEDFKKYIDNELYWEKNKNPNSLLSTEYVSWTFWSRENGKPECPPTPPHDEFWEFFSQHAPIWATLKFNEKILAACRDIVHYSYQNYPLLVQFWEHRTMEGRSFLTCQHQPFALQSIDKGMDIEGLCSFRIISKDYKFYVDGEGEEEELGLPGRVFLHGSPESSPNVEYYSLREYPLRDHALRCQVRSSFAFPVFEPPGQSCVGVLELLSTARGPLYEFYICYNALENVGLKCSDAPGHNNIPRRDIDEALKPAVNEILKVSKVVCKVHELRLAKIWVPCRVCLALVDRGFTLTNLIMLKRHESMENDQDATKFSYVCTRLHLRTGQGVAGRALLSPNLIYCIDVSQFRITEYPLAHFAKEYGFSGCFGIYLQSTYIGNDPYILEFFFPASYKGSVVDTRTLLREILRTMKKNFQSFKLAFGADLTEELPIEVIDIQNNNINTDFVVPVPVPEPSQNGGDQMMLLDSMAQESIDVIDNGRNIDVICSHEKGTIMKSAGRGKKKTTGVRIPIRLDDILKTSKMRLKDAADKLDVSQSTFKRACREYDIKRWPPRKTVEFSPSRPSECPPLVDDQEKIPQLNSDVPYNHQAHATVDADNVTIKAKYGKYVIIFELSLSSTMEELHQEVAKRLKLKVETYDIVYKLVDDLVLIACNEDLQRYIHTYRSQNATSLEMLLEPK